VCNNSFVVTAVAHYCSRTTPNNYSQFITGVSPTVDPDVSDDFDVEHSLFEEVIWPTIAHRVPSFEAIKGKLEISLFAEDPLHCLKLLIAIALSSGWSLGWAL